VDQIPQAAIIGRALFGYFGMKLATERVVEQSGIGAALDADLIVTIAPHAA
jgi:hypothetical protein